MLQCLVLNTSTSLGDAFGHYENHNTSTLYVCCTYFHCTVLQVTMLQLEKTYGRNKEAKQFIQELVQGVLSLNFPLCEKNLPRPERW